MGADDGSGLKTPASAPAVPRHPQSTGRARRRLLNWVAPVFSGLLCYLAFPPLSLSFLAWVALVPYLFAIHRISRYNYLVGTLLFVGSFLGSHISWMFRVMPVGYLGIIVTAFLLHVPFGFLFRNIRSEGFLSNVQASAAWVLIEYLRMKLGLSWGALGYSQWDCYFLRQSADLFGVYGLSFIIVWSNVTIFSSIKRVLEKRAFVPVQVAALILVLSCLTLYGMARTRGKDLPDTVVVVVQPNLSVEEKLAAPYDPKLKREVLTRMSQLSLAIPGRSPHVIIWPETSIPGFLEYEAVVQEAVEEVRRQTGALLIVGGQGGAISSYPRYNSVFLWGNSQTLERYDKLFLVPMYEYLPFFYRWFPEANITMTMGNTPGEQSPCLRSGKFRIGVSICYEDSFSPVLRSAVLDGANVLMNLSNLQMFGRSSVAYQALSMAVFRAIENRRFLVRCANSGLSAIVRPDGSLSLLIGAGPSDILRAGSGEGAVALRDEVTLFTRMGDDGFAALLTVVLLGTALAQWRSLSSYPIAQR